MFLRAMGALYCGCRVVSGGGVGVQFDQSNDVDLHGLDGVRVYKNGQFDLRIGPCVQRLVNGVGGVGIST